MPEGSLGDDWIKKAIRLAQAAAPTAPATATQLLEGFMRNQLVGQELSARKLAEIADSLLIGRTSDMPSATE